MKFSVVLEAVTQAFSKAMSDAKANYTTATAGIAADSAKLDTTTTALKDKLTAVFQAKDATGVTAALKSATAELQNTAKGATLTADQLRLIGSTSKTSVNELTAALRTAQAEFKILAASKATPADIDAAKAKIGTLKVEVASAQAEYGRFQVAASAAMRRAAQDTQDAADKTKVAGKAIYDALNIKTGGQLRAEIAAITRELAAFKASAGAPAEEVQRVHAAAALRIRELKGELQGVGPAGKAAGAGIKDMVGSIAGVAGVTLGLAAVKQGIEAILTATIKFEQVNKQLEYATGSSAKAAAEFEFVRKVANSMGLELLSAADGYAKLAAATKGTRLEGEGTRVLFQGIAAASATMGLSVENTNGVILALSQIAGKGKVSMEELRGQLGERLTPAMEIAAKAMGVTRQELEGMVEAGIDSTYFLEKFGPALLDTFGPTAATNVKTLNGQLNLMKNEFTELLIKLGTGEGGLGGVAAGVFGDMRKGMQLFQDALNSVDASTIDAVNEAFKQLYELIGTTFTTLMTAVADAAGYIQTLVDAISGVVGGFTGLDQSAEKVDFLTRTMQGLSITLGLISDGVKGIGIMFTVATGSAQLLFSAIAAGLAKVTFGQLSAELKQFSDDLLIGAAASFARAEKAAMDFSSSAVAAADKAVGAHVKAADDSAKAHVSGSKVAADAQGTVGKAAAAAANEIVLANLKGERATFKIAEAGAAVSKAFMDLAKDAGIAMPAAARSIEQMGAVLGEVGVANKQLADSIARELPAAIAKLNGPELLAFERAFIGGMERAGASVKDVERTMEVFATRAVASLGGDIAPAINHVSQQFNDQRVVLNSLIGDWDNLSASGINAAQAITSAMDGMLTRIRNPVEIQQLITTWESLGAQGKITGDMLAEGLNKAKTKLDELTPGINSLAEAFKTFGLQSREEAALMATKYKEAFDVMTNSGKATSNELQTAFTKYAETAISAAGGVVDAELAAQAEMLGLAIKADATGKIIVTAMTQAGNSTKQVGNDADGAAAAYTNMGTAAERAALKVLAAGEAQVAMQQRINKLKEDEIALENKRLNQDAEKFTLNTAGQKTVMANPTWMSVLNQLKQWGVTDQADAQRITGQFVDERGQLKGLNSTGYQTQNGDSFDVVLRRAAEAWLRSGATNGAQAGSGSGATQAQAGGSSGGAVTISFVGADGRAATVQTTAGTTAQDVIGVLRTAGATSVVQRF